MKGSLTIGFTLLVLLVQGQEITSRDRVYAANQVSNTISVIDPVGDSLVGEISLGKPYPDVLHPLYRGQALVHGLRYCEKGQLLVVVSIGSNAVTFISTKNNRILKTVYVGRSPHEPTFTPDGKQVWVSVRGENYISVIDAVRMIELKRIRVSDGPGMVAFTKDGREAYVCSSFTPVLEIVNTSSALLIKRIPVASPFSPNIFTSPDGRWIAFTHKDSGRVTVMNTATRSIEKILVTGPITNHVTFAIFNKRLLMLVTPGLQNLVRVYDVVDGFAEVHRIAVGALPHGIWPSPDGRYVFIGLEYADAVQKLDLSIMEVTKTIAIGQSPQALLYARNAVDDKAQGMQHLVTLTKTQQTMVWNLSRSDSSLPATGRVVARTIGLAALFEQSFSGLKPHTGYVLLLSASEVPTGASYPLNSFLADASGKYGGESGGPIVRASTAGPAPAYRFLLLTDANTGTVVLTTPL